jgi:hypothetical protein
MSLIKKHDYLYYYFLTFEMVIINMNSDRSIIKFMERYSPNFMQDRTYGVREVTV